MIMCKETTHQPRYWYNTSAMSSDMSRVGCYVYSYFCWNFGGLCVSLDDYEIPVFKPIKNWTLTNDDDILYEKVPPKIDVFKDAPFKKSPLIVTDDDAGTTKYIQYYIVLYREWLDKEYWKLCLSTLKWVSAGYQIWNSNQCGWKIDDFVRI